MYKILLSIFFPFLVFASMHFTKAELEYIKNKKVILVSNEYDYEPYDYFKNNTSLGYSLDLLNLLLKDTGLKIKYITKPWNELLKDLDNKKIDLVHTIYKTAEREKKYKYSQGYSKVVQSYIIRKNEEDIKKIEDLFGKKVGVSKGWSEEFFFNKYPQIEKKYYANLEEKLSALSLGKIDAIMNSENVANYYIKKYGYGSIKISNPVKDTNNLDDHHFITLKDNPYLISILDKAYNNLSLEKLDELNKKWFGSLVYKRILFTNEERTYLNNKNKVNFCIDPNWIPFEFLNEKGEYSGISSDYFSLFEKILPLDFNLVKTKSWSQSLAFAKERKCDILALAMKTPQRDEYLNFTSPYLLSPLVITTKLSVPFIDNIDNLKGKKVGIIKDYAVAELLKNKYPWIDIVDVKSIEDGLEMVFNDEIFGYIDTLPSISYSYQNLQKYELKIVGKLDFSWKLGIAVRNDDTVLLNILQKAVDSITSDEKRLILNKWISIKYEKGKDYSLLWKLLALFVIVLILFIYKQYLMKKSINEFTRLIDSTIEAIIIFKNNKCINTNKSAVKIFNYDSKKELINKSIYDFISDEHKELVEKKIHILNTFPYEILAKKKDGTNFYAMINSYEVKSKDIFVLSIIDITHIKQLEAQTKQAQMGEMIENIAHQWRQPLSTISTIASGIHFNYEEEIEQDPKVISSSMEKIVNTTNHLSETIDIFRNFLKETKEYKEIVLQDRINIAIEIVAATLKNNLIDLRNNIDPNPIKLYIVVGELGQVIINILNNAKDALKERNIENPWIELGLIKEENKVILTIEDNAKGIKEEYIDKIFDPYFTTKHSSQGTGLGLHMSYKIVTESLKGKLYVNNTKNGAKFNIEIPINKGN